jgi:hypothetical protein
VNPPPRLPPGEPAADTNRQPAGSNLETAPVTDSLCVIVPVRNAEAALADQVERLLEVLPDVAGCFEVLIVDDASTDHTAEIARELARRYPQVCCYEHAQPLGMEAAIATGRRRACASSVVVQEDPAALSAAELRRMCPTCQPRRAIARQDKPQLVFDPQLLERLSRWGEALVKHAAERRADAAHDLVRAGQRVNSAECTTTPTGRP